MQKKNLKKKNLHNKIQSDRDKKTSGMCQINRDWKK